MKNISRSRQIRIIIILFITSRIAVMLMGLHLDMWPIRAYWQYLDLETLKNHLMAGIWYDHAQPPGFNLFLGFILKIAGSRSTFIFSVILKAITLANAFLLFSITEKLSRLRFLPMAVALVYILSPATIIFECELFYTTSISFLLLVSIFYLIRFAESNKGLNAAGYIFPLVLLCLTRSVYHIFWLTGCLSFLIYYFRKKAVLHYLIPLSLAGIMMVGSWYVKNKMIFGKFTSSTWIGMNLARNVFHENDVRDSSRIEAYEPFSKISVYRKFLNPQFENAYKGLNDRDLLQEWKNDSFINETEVSYIPVSDLYQKASLDFIRKYPGSYAKNVLQSSILYFTPATVYSLSVEKAAKIKAYDLLYSWNLTVFAKNKSQRRILLTASAIPKMLIYFFVFFILIRSCIRSGSISPWNLFIMITIGYVFGISSLFEHYENMRFRFETEPLFLVLAVQVFTMLLSKRRSLKHEA